MTDKGNGAIISSVISDNEKRCGGNAVKHEITIVSDNEPQSEALRNAGVEPTKWKMQVITEYEPIA